MAYRLYTEEVRNGLVDFNDEYYHVLASKLVDGILIGFVYSEHKFVVAYKLEYDELNSIHWGQGHYYEDLSAAMKKYESYRKQNDNTQVVVILDYDEVLSVVEVANFDDSFEDAVKGAKEKYYESDNGNLLEDFMFDELANAGYAFESVSYETALL